MLDGVRAVAALMVVTLHLSEIAGVPWSINGAPFLTTFVVFGRMGVDLFFVLSGFLLFRPYASALLFQDPWPSMRRFYLRRAFRIWPGYYITLCAMILLFGGQYLNPDHWKRLVLFLTFFMDSSHQTWQQLNGPFWTLAIEWQFYLLLPWIALGFSRLLKHAPSSPRQRLLIVLGCCVAIILWGFVIKGIGVYFARHSSATILLPRSALNLFLFFTFGMQGKYLEVFASGMIVCTCYLFAQHPKYGSALKVRIQQMSNTFWSIGIFLLLCLSFWHAQATGPRDGNLSTFSAFPFLNPLTPYFPWLGEPIAGLGFASCVLALLFGSQYLRWIFERRFVRWIGMISYGIYMWNQKLIGLFCAQLVNYFPQLDSFWRYTACWLFVLIGLLPFCYVFYRVVEKPGIRLGTWLANRKSTLELIHLFLASEICAHIWFWRTRMQPVVSRHALLTGRGTIEQGVSTGQQHQ